MRIIISLLISIICSAVSFAQQQAVGLYMINGDTETAMTPIKYKNIKISGTFSKTARLEFADAKSQNRFTGTAKFKFVFGAVDAYHSMTHYMFAPMYSVNDFGIAQFEVNSSKRIMTINIISEKEEGNFETDDNPTNAINGKGSNVNVHFNPESNPDIPTLNRKTGRVGNKKRPSQVGLAHEMIHGDRSMRGVAIEYSESESYSYINNRGQRVMETLSKEEAATVGLNHVKKNDITENDIRKDQGLNPRGAY